MTESTLVASPEGVKLERNTGPSVVFINWLAGDARVSFCDLLDRTDFSHCKLAFFDPLIFAQDHGFWTKGHEISDISYVSFQEKEFMRYLADVKTASDTLRAFLQNDGVLIVRANLPKSFIKVRKRSSTGTMKYTESVVSTFFWLDDLLGALSLNYCQAKTLKYIQSKNPLREALGDVAVQCVQTVNSVTGGKLEIVACGGSIRSAAIARITFDPQPGQAYLIPRFLIKEEYKFLIEAFEQIYQGRRFGSVRPQWLRYYESQLRDFSPYRPHMKEIELQLEALQKRQASLQRKQDKFNGLANLLFENDTELETAVRVALEILGFECKAAPGSRKAAAFEARPVGDRSTRLTVRAVGTDSGPVTLGEVRKLSTAIAASTSAVTAKGLLVSNSLRTIQPEHRETWFDEKALEEARRQDFCLMPSLVLFTMACYVMSRLDADNIEDLKNSLRRDIIQCDSLFILSRRKYAV